MRTSILFCISYILALYTYGATDTISRIVPADHSKAADTQRLVSYNIRHAKGMDLEINYNRIASVLSTLNPDFIALQELDSVTSRSNYVNQPELLGKMLGMHAYFGAAIPYAGGKYGIGILSKEPALNTYVYNLPGTEPRACFIAEFEDYLLVCVHFDLTEKHRIESIGIIADKIKPFNKKAFMAGDFNEDDLSGTMFTELFKHWKIESAIKNTFPTGKPDTSIDYIVSYTPGGKYDVQKTDIVYDLPKVDVAAASDHYPLYIDFK